MGLFSWFWWRRCTQRTSVGWDAVGNRTGNGVTGVDTDRSLAPPRPTAVAVRVQGRVKLDAAFTGTPPSTIALQFQQTLYGCLDSTRNLAVSAAVDTATKTAWFDYAYAFTITGTQIDKFLDPAPLVSVTDVVNDPPGGAIQFQTIADQGSIEVTYTF